MEIKKRIEFFLIIILIIMPSFFLIASDTGNSKGLNNICLTQPGFNRGFKWIFGEENDDDINMLSYDVLKSQLESKGYKTDYISMKKYFLHIPGLSKRMWNASIDTLLECESFAGHKETFIKNLNKRKRDLVYAWNLGGFGQRDVFGNMFLSHNRLYDLVLYIAEKLAETGEGEEPNFDDFEEKVPLSATSTIAHELMHALGELEAYFEEDNKKFECIVCCFEFKCFGFSNFYPYCNEEQYCKLLPKDCREKIKCNQDLPNNDNKTKTAKGTTEHSDHGDDNFSYASPLPFLLDSTTLAMEDYSIPTNKDFLSLNYYPDILIYDKFNYRDMPLLLDKFTGFSYINDYNHDFFPNNHKVLVIPSGELMGDEDSEIIKNAIRLFVESGGTVVALAQQYGEHFENLMPIPEVAIFFHTNYSTTILFLIESVVVDYNSLC